MRHAHRCGATPAPGTTIITGSLKVGPGVGNGTRTATHVVYGRIPQLQDADTGNYTDSILVTLTF